MPQAFTERIRPSLDCLVVTLHYPVNPLRNHVTRQPENDQSRRNAEEPRQVSLVLLPRYPNVHTPHASHNIHGQDDRTEDREFAEDIRCLFRALVHADVNLSEVVGVGARQ